MPDSRGQRSATGSKAGLRSAALGDGQWQHAADNLEALIWGAPDAIITADEAGLILTWNASAERIFGYATGQVIGRPLTMLMPQRFRAAHEAGIKRVTETGQARVIGTTVELAGLRHDGTEFPIELSLGTWTAGGARYFSGIIRDVSERVRLAQEVAEKNNQLEALSSKLAKYLSRQLYESIFEGRTEVRVTSYREKLTIFFSDIQGFTELTDRMEAEALSQLLNDYLSEMSVIAERYGGTVDKFIGDGIMIFFGAPEGRGVKEDALACAEMALQMRKRVHELQDDWRNQGVPGSLHVRMGINTGYATVGNFGSESRLNYTIVGGQVNAAARLETAAEPDSILVSGETHALIKDTILGEPAGEIKVKGIAHPIRTYRVVGHRDKASLRPIEERRPGFRLLLDPAELTAEDVGPARDTLRQALQALEHGTGGATPEAGAVGTVGRSRSPVRGNNRGKDAR